MRASPKTKLLQHLTNKTTLICLVSICVIRFSTTVLNMGIYPEVASYFGVAREINTYVGVLAMIVLAIVSVRAPALIDAKTLTALSGLLFILGGIMLSCALPTAHKALTAIGLCCIGIARDWLVVMLYVSLSSLKEKGDAIVAVGGGVLVGFLLYPIGALLSAVTSVIVYCILPGLLIIPLYRISAPLIRATTSEKSLSEMRIMNPFSFLGPTHPVLVAILLFNIAFGFSLSFNIQQTTPVGLSLVGAIAVLISVALLLRKKHRALDSLFSFSALLVIGGYLTSIAFIGSENGFSNTILTAGSAIFSILVYLVIASVISRNPWGMIPLAAWTIAFGGLGTVVGADVGHILNSMVMHNTQTSTLFICAVLMLFVSYLWLSMRNLSFEKELEGIVAVPPDRPHDTDARFEDNVAAISLHFGLTDRESEILLLLAKGRNSVFLQGHFVVSKNTIKTHIKHIYHKLDVHSRQEVINLIEQHHQRS